MENEELVYDYLEPGDPWMVDKDTSLYVACCDCGLVHRIDITDVLSDGLFRQEQYRLEFWRDDEETERVRQQEMFPFTAAQSSSK